MGTPNLVEGATEVRRAPLVETLTTFGLVRMAVVIGLGVFILVYPFIFSGLFPQHVMIMIFLYAMLGQAWNIIGGYAGQVSLGHAAYLGIGAYTSTVLLLRWNISPWIGMLAGGLVAVLVSLIIGYPCFRLKGHYFVIATIAVASVIQTSFINWQDVGGAVGLYVPFLKESFINFQFKSRAPFYYISLAMLTAIMVLTYWIERSRMGFYFRAIKQDLDAARSLGIDPTKYKLIAMSFSALFTAFGGSFYAQYLMFIDPETVFHFILSVIICLIAVVGGAGTLWGPILGALMLIPLSEFTRVYLGSTTAVHLITYGAMITIVAVFQPKGLIGLLQRFRRQG
ncbi:MAG: branched-chain amino acid ABC transporter permease [Chloroflexi bacterium]|nr:branched-chain amino acid ABC transporter permease [Chloroflexota bacterium]MCL5074987.1 branched-chain amino acid ABC transporter permease [Chloroflexota bacterium]